MKCTPLLASLLLTLPIIASASWALPNATFPNVRSLLAKECSSAAWHHQSKCKKMISYLEAAGTIRHPHEHKPKTVKKAAKTLEPLLATIKKTSVSIAAVAQEANFGADAAQQRLDARIAALTLEELARILAAADACIPPTLGEAEAGIAFYDEFDLVLKLVTAQAGQGNRCLLEDEIKREEAKRDALRRAPVN